MKNFNDRGKDGIEVETLYVILMIVVYILKPMLQALRMMLSFILFLNQDSTSALSKRQCFPIFAQGICPSLQSLYNVDFGTRSHLDTSSAFSTF